MNKNTTKTIAILVLSMVIFSTITGTAKASVFDWISSNVNVSGSHFEFAYTTLNQAGLTADNTENSTNTDLIQGNYLVTSGTPTNRKNAKTKTTPESWSEELTVVATGYSSTVDQTDEDPFTTAWGTRVRNGIIAANFLPFGTKIKIPEIFGDKVFVVEDRMNRRYWKNIDIWFTDRGSALEFGVRKVKIQVLNS